MKKKVIKLFEKRIDQLYNESRSLLLLDTSYTIEKVNLMSVHLFLAFLESSLVRPYNRLSTLSIFINDPDDFRVDLMYPFFLLTDEVRQSIGAKESEAIKLATALDVSEINENFTLLRNEEHLLLTNNQ